MYMPTYEEIKNWLKEKENKNKLVVSVSFVLIFVVGFGTGRYEKQIRRDVYKPQTNYTTKAGEKPVVGAANPPLGTAQGGGGEKVAVAATGTAVTLCVIKGNISSSKKIYHVKGGAFFERTNAEMCFNTEAEAIAAGFVKSSC